MEGVWEGTSVWRVCEGACGVCVRVLVCGGCIWQLVENLMAFVVKYLHSNITAI